MWGDRKLKTVEEKKWFLIDAQEQVLGRMSSKIAILLQGKHKPT
ncbi:MAG: uL13 family ribosomal protein, partial [bacterium]|nr:uL13 family ribosomal protein [bacterium]